MCWQRVPLSNASSYSAAELDLICSGAIVYCRGDQPSYSQTTMFGWGKKKEAPKASKPRADGLNLDELGVYHRIRSFRSLLAPCEIIRMLLDAYVHDSSFKFLLLTLDNHAFV